MSELHFTHPIYLIAWIAVPIAWAIYFLFYQNALSQNRLKAFIDSHLIPYLIQKNESATKNSAWKALLLWSLAWSLFCLALMGPRWNEREVETFSKDQNLVILLDLSESMNAGDVKPSRLIRAKQKIEDLISAAQGVKIALIAYAADPHMITPLTEDMRTIKHLLPSLDTSLIFVQGSKLTPALEMAFEMLKNEGSHNNAILIISDGGFEDMGALTEAKKIASENIPIYTWGVGTDQGAPLTDKLGNLIKKNESVIISKLESEKLQSISRLTSGTYFELNPLDTSASVILKELHDRAETSELQGKKRKIFEEGFYFFLIPLIPVYFYWFRKRSLLLLLFLLSPLYSPLNADLLDTFKNSEQRGESAFQRGDFDEAESSFQDPYRKGVASYRKGDFSAAENYFRISNREEVKQSAAYNLSNALAKQEKYQEAKEALEAYLQQWPGDERAQENLELIKKILEEEKKQNSDSKNEESNNNQDQKQNQGSDNSSDPKNEKNSENSHSSEDKRNPKDSNTPPSQDNSEPDKNEEGDTSKDQAHEEDQPEDQANETLDTQKEAPAKEKEAEPIEPKSSDAQETEKPNEGKEKAFPLSEKEKDAEMLLNRIDTDPKEYMKNKFYLESKRNKTTKGIDPW